MAWKWRDTVTMARRNFIRVAGGGIINMNGAVNISNSHFSGNTGAGAIRISSAPAFDAVRVSKCTFDGNKAWAVYHSGTGSVANSLMKNNHQGLYLVGAAQKGDVTVTNTVIDGTTREALVAMLGRAQGRHLHALAHNRDPRPVHPRRRRRSIGSQRALGRFPRSPDAIDAVAIGLVERVTRRMRTAGRAGRTVVLRLRFDDFSRATRSHTLPRATAQTGTILETTRLLLAAAMPTIERDGITLVGISVANLDDGATLQLELPLDGHDGVALDAALDEIRERFGPNAVLRAVLLGRDHGLTVPLLPD